MDLAVSKTATSVDDVHAILRLMNEYSWALDNNDWDGLRKSFAKPMQFLASTMAPVTDVEVLINGLSSRAGTFAHRRHMQSNGYVRIDGDRAFYTGNMINPRVQAEKSDHDFFLAGGYYRNEFVRTNEGWKISVKCWQDVYSEGGLPPAMQKAGVAGYGTSAFPRVLDDLIDGATFGFGEEYASDPLADDRAKVHDSVSRLFRAADASSFEHAEAVLQSEATAEVAGAQHHGASSVLEAISANGIKRLTHIANECIQLTDRGAVFVAYYYSVAAPAEGGENQHQGGVLRAELSNLDGKWRIRHLTVEPLWDRDSDVSVTSEQNQTAGLIGSFRDSAQSAVTNRETSFSELLSRFVMACDTQHREAMAKCLASDVTRTSGDVVTSGRDAVVAEIIAESAGVASIQTCLFNTVVDVIGDDAEAKSYVLIRRATKSEGIADLYGARLYAKARFTDGEPVITSLELISDFGPYR